MLIRIMKCLANSETVLLPPLRITSADASSGRRGGEDQRPPPRAGGRRRNATVSLYHPPAVYPFIFTHARVHARTSRATVAVLCICLCVYGGESLMRQASTVGTCIGNGTSHIDYRSKKHQEVRMFPMPFRENLLLHHEISFVSCCVTTGPSPYKIRITLNYPSSKSIINSKFLNF